MHLSNQLTFFLKTPGFSEFVGRFGYIGIVVWFLTLDQFTPIPEEVSLLTVGYLSAHRIFNPFIAGVFCLVGFLIVDTIYFFLSKKGSSWIKKKTEESSSTMQQYKKKLNENMPVTIIVLCFIPRMRMFAPILAGSMKLPFRKFLLFDSLALSAFTAIYIVVGFVFNKSLQRIISETKGLETVVFFAAVLIVAVIIVASIRKRKNRRSKKVSL